MSQRVWDRMFDPDASPGRAPPLPKDVPTNSKMVYSKYLVRYIPVDPTKVWDKTGSELPIYPKDREQIKKRIADVKKAMEKARVWGPHSKPRSNSPYTRYLKNAEAARLAVTPTSSSNKTRSARSRSHSRSSRSSTRRSHS
jgi:hypothetical protein